MILYLDTSSLVKLLIEEDGSAAVRALVARTDSIASSLVAYPETRSVLARGARARRFSAAGLAAARREFETYWGTADVIRLDETMAREAGGLADRHGLKALDAIHLASAIALQRETREEVSFTAWDNALLSAARGEGLAVV